MQGLEEFMADEKTQGGGAATEEALGPNTVRVTFLPENKTFEFEHGKLPYQEHGKPRVDSRRGHELRPASGARLRRQLRLHDMSRGGEERQGMLSEMDDDEADRLDMAADLQLNSRLGCQAVIEKPGEVVVEIPSWNRNYVSEAATHHD